MHVVARHLEHVARLVENGEGAGGRDVLEADDAVELILGHTDAGRPADLHGLSVLRPAIVQHLADADAKGVFVDTRPRAIAGHRQNLGSGRVLGADAGIPVAPLQRDHRRRGKGFDVIDDGRLVEIAIGHRERRPVARRAALAFERLDQRRFLAANVGPGADVDLDIEIRPRDAEDVLAEQLVPAAPGEDSVQAVEQVAIFATQIDEALGRPHGIGRHGHAFENQIGKGGQQHAILEGARLTLVGVAHHDTAMAGLELGIAAGLPFQAGGEAGTAPAAQVGALDLVEHGNRPAHAARQAFAPGPHVGGHQAFVGRPGAGGAQRLTRLEIGGEQDVGPADVVLDLEELGRPVGQRHLAANQLGNGVDARFGQPGNRQVIDQQRRPLVAHAGTGRLADADQAILGHLAALDPQAVAQALHQCPVTLHAVGDVVGKQHPVLAAWFGVKEGIEAGDALDLGARHPEGFLQAVDGFRRNPVAGFLYLAQDLHHVRSIAPMARHHPVDHAGNGFGMHCVECHDNLRQTSYDSYKTSTAR